MAEQKIIGWGKNSVKNGTDTFNDIVQGSTALSVEEGAEQERSDGAGAAGGEGSGCRDGRFGHEFKRGNFGGSLDQGVDGVVVHSVVASIGCNGDRQDGDE